MKRLMVLSSIFLLLLSTAFTKSLDINLLAGNNIIPTSGGKAYVLIELEGTSQRVTARSPLNLSIVLDRSGSMSGSKIKYVKQAAVEAINMLSEEIDIASVVIYDDRIDVIFPAGKVNKSQIRSAVSEVTARGMTALHGGLMKGVEETKRNVSKKNVSRVLLLSDGLANTGVTSIEEIARDSRKSYEKGVTISTIGVGADYNENLMVAIGNAAHGNYYFIERPSQTSEIFAKEFASLLSVVAKDIKLDLKTKNNAKIGKAIGYKLKGVQIEANHVFSSGKSFFLLELEVPRGNTGSKTIPFELKVEYFDVLTKKTEKIKKSLTLTYANMRNKKYNPLKNAKVQAHYLELQLADDLEVVTKHMDKGKNKNAKAILNTQISRLSKANKSLKSKKIEGEIGKLKKQLKTLDALGDRHYRKTEAGRNFKKAVQADNYIRQSR